MATPKKKPAAPEPQKSQDAAEPRKSDLYAWKSDDKKVCLTLGLGKGMGDRLEKALKDELRIREVGPNELFASFLYHGLVHFEREFPLRERKAKAKKDGRAWVPPEPEGRVEKQKARLDNIEAWLVRVKAVQAALEKGDLEPAKALARESIIKNTKLAEEARSAWTKAVKTMGTPGETDKTKK